MATSGRLPHRRLVLALVAGCKEDNRLVTPPPPRIGVALPLQQQVTPHLEATGTAVAVNSVDLAARVQGFLSAITYKDGDLVKRGDVLFQIEPTEYQAKLQQAQAAPANSQAQLVQAEAELNRQSTLGREAWSAQSTIEQAQALRDGLRATITGQQAESRWRSSTSATPGSPRPSMAQSRRICSRSATWWASAARPGWRRSSSSIRSMSASPSVSRTHCGFAPKWPPAA